MSVCERLFLLRRVCHAAIPRRRCLRPLQKFQQSDQYFAPHSTVYTEGAEKLCRSGWVEPTDGRCSDGMQSKAKGAVCKTSADCPSSRAGTYSTCRCGLNNNGSRYCGIEGGDSDWVEARKAVPFTAIFYLVYEVYRRDEELPQRRSLGSLRETGALQGLVYRRIISQDMCRDQGSILCGTAQ